MSCSEIPIGLGLILCDTVIEDKFTGKKSLIGLFGQLRVPRFPWVHPSISLLVSMTGGQGKYPCEVICRHADLESPVFAVRGEIGFANPGQVIDLVFQLRAVRFPMAATYSVQVLVDEIPLMIRPLAVNQRQNKKPGGPAEPPENK